MEKQKRALKLGNLQMMKGNRIDAGHSKRGRTATMLRQMPARSVLSVHTKSLTNQMLKEKRKAVLKSEQNSGFF